jgi:hypothetical protein
VKSSLIFCAVASFAFLIGRAEARESVSTPTAIVALVDATENQSNPLADPSLRPDDCFPNDICEECVGFVCTPYCCAYAGPASP